MRAFIILILSLGALITLTACGKPSLEDAKLSDKQLNLEEYFDGRPSPTANSTIASAPCDAGLRW
jgi:hypothetical protein